MGRVVAAASPIGDDQLRFALQRGGAAFEALRRCVVNSGEKCEGNVFHRAGRWDLEPEMVGKQKNLFSLVRALPASSKSGRTPSVLEIGFNAGHSVCLMLLANPEVRVVAFDLCEHAYAKPCAQKLQHFFGEERVKLVEGPSGDTIPAYIATHPEESFDLFHIDGGHQYLVAMADIMNCRSLSLRLSSTFEEEARRSLVVLDDTDLVGIAAVWSDSVAAGHVLEVEPPNAMGQFKHSIGEFVHYIDVQDTCAACGKNDACWACGGCHSLRYCCESCARTHWKRHRQVCESRQPPPLSFPVLRDVVPGPSGMLMVRTDGSLIASRCLDNDETLCLEPPLAWQPYRESREQRCSCCGAGLLDGAGWRRCEECHFAGRCEECWNMPCIMCPELKITGGTAAPVTLLVLDLIRRRHARKLSSNALVLPVAHRVDDMHKQFAARVQRVGHFCSAVKWTDEVAAETVAAILPGIHEVPGAGLCFFPTLARLRAVPPSEGTEFNLKPNLAPSSEHMFALKVNVSRTVQAGSCLHLRPKLLA